MASTQTAMLTFRLNGLEEALRATNRAHIPIANRVEVIIQGYCRRNGVAIAEQSGLSHTIKNASKAENKP